MAGEQRQPTKQELTFFRADLFYTRLDKALTNLSYFAMKCRLGSYIKFSRGYYATLKEVFMICYGYIPEVRKEKVTNRDLGNPRQEIEDELNEVKKILEKKSKKRADFDLMFEKLEKLYTMLKLNIKHLEVPIKDVLDMRDILEERMK